MPEATKSETTTRDGGVSRTVTITERPAAPPAPTKSFKLRQGARHTHSGIAVRPGDVVELTESQAKAFRDKFDAVDDSEFKVPDQPFVYDPSKQESDRRTSGKKAEFFVTEGQAVKSEDAPQGMPTPTPPVPVRVAGVPVGPSPADPRAIDPDRQGQHSRETRAVIDAAGGPAATAVIETEQQRLDREQKARDEAAAAIAGATAAPAAVSTTRTTVATAPAAPAAARPAAVPGLAGPQGGNAPIAGKPPVVDPTAKK